MHEVPDRNCLITAADGIAAAIKHKVMKEVERRRRKLAWHKGKTYTPQPESHLKSEVFMTKNGELHHIGGRLRRGEILLLRFWRARTSTMCLKMQIHNFRTCAKQSWG